MPPGLFRILLASAVVIQHFSRAALGTVAVYIFFMLSGYWVSRMWRQKYIHLPAPYWHFVVSRAGRLLPTFLLVSAIMIAVRWWVGDLLDLDIPSRMSSVVLLGYASIPRGGYLIPAWSLDIEMQFYLFAPLLLLALSRRRKSTTGFLAVFSVASLVFLSSQSATIFPTVLPYLNFFCVGIATASYDWRPRPGLALASIGLLTAAIGISLFVPHLRGLVLAGAHSSALSEFNGPASAMLAMVAAPFAMSTVWIRSGKVDRAAGDLSYVLYLVHFVFAWTVDHFWGSLPARDRLPFVAAALAMTIVSSVLIWALYDRPVGQWRERWLRRVFDGKSVGASRAQHAVLRQSSQGCADYWRGLFWAN